MAKRYVIVDPRVLRAAAAQLDRTFRPPARSPWAVVWSAAGSKWMAWTKLGISAVLLALAAWRMVHG